MGGPGDPKPGEAASPDVRARMEPRDDEIDLTAYVATFRRIWWKVLLLSLAVGILVLAAALRRPNVYTATAVVAPVSEEGTEPSALRALSSFGINVGGPSKVEDLETLFRSNDLTARVFGNHDLWPIVLPDRYDAETGKLKVSWLDRLLRDAEEPGPPTEWDAVRAVEDRLNVAVNRKAETVSVSFESRSPEGSASVVKHYLDEGKSRLQEEALERAARNKRFIAEQIQKTVDPLTRDRLYSLYGQEVEREMLARNREQFGFKLVDRPWVPDRKSGPRRAKAALLAMVLASLFWTVVLGLRANNAAARRESESNS